MYLFTVVPKTSYMINIKLFFNCLSGLFVLLSVIKVYVSLTLTQKS